MHDAVAEGRSRYLATFGLGAVKAAILAGVIGLVAQLILQGKQLRFQPALERSHIFLPAFTLARCMESQAQILKFTKPIV